MLEHKKRIGIDLDGTLIDFVTPLVGHINIVHGTTLKPEDITSYDFESSPKVREQILAYRFLTIGLPRSSRRSVPCLPECVQLLYPLPYRLQKRHCSKDW